MEFTNAIQYLKSNGFTDNKTFSWINPILNKALNNELSHDDINSLITNITKNTISPEGISEIESETATTTEEIIESKIEVAEIKEICSVNNFGLLNITEPIKLKSNLNVFYGMNGVGKSSIYKAICGPLGTEDKKCIPNINNDNKNMQSKIKIKDTGGNEKTLEFMGDKNNTLDVRIFDSEISRYTISNDHENEFIVPYLKQEFFFILRDLLDTISSRLSDERSNIYNRINEIKQLFNNKLDFLDEEYKNIEKRTKETQFSEQDKQNLEEFNKTKTMIESDTAKVVLQSYNDRIADVDKVLEKLCMVTVIDDKPTYSNKFSASFFKSYTADLDNYLKCKNLFESNNIEKIGDYIPKDWINKKEWYSFVEAGLSFVASLTGEDKSLYSDKKCPFCNQDLNDSSKVLINSYNNLKSTCKADMDKYKVSIDNSKNETVELINFIEELDKLIIKAFDTIKAIDDKQVNDFESQKIKTHLEIVKEGLEKYETYEDKGLNNYTTAINRIIEFRKILSDKIVDINNQLAEKDKEIEKIKNSIKPLETSKIISENISFLTELVDKLKIVDDIDKKVPNITALKSNLSKYQASFSNESTIKMFKDNLYEEYRALNFALPEKLNIKPQKNKRLCRVGDYKLLDIYSEGEMKIHSLAEFFAKAKVDQFKGVYIFDDPVNSLDYERIEYVKNRILKLVSEGNQVLVFTHNIYFLNSLVNTEKDKVCEVVKTNDQICIINENILGDKDKPIKQYKDKIEKRMKELNSRDIKDIDSVDLSAVYDLISGCLENYVENKLLNGLIGRYRPNIRMYGLQDLKSIDDEIVDKIYNLYNSTSRYGNRHDSPLESLPPTYDTLKTHYSDFKSIVG